MEQKTFGFGSFVRIIISWIVLPVMYYIFYFVGTLCSKFLSWVAREISVLSSAMQIVIILIGGSFFLALIIYPLVYGAVLTVAASEKVYSSKNGTRYIVFSVILITLTVLSFLGTLIAGTINIAAIYVFIYCVLLIVFRQKRSNEEVNKPKPINEEEEVYKLVSRYAAKIGMGVRDYCVYCLEESMKSRGIDDATAKQKAEERAAEQPNTHDLAYGVVVEFSTRANMTIPQYLQYCKNEENKNPTP